MAVTEAVQLYERRKRRVYLVTLTVALLAALVLMSVQGLDDPGQRVALPTITLVAATLLVAIWWKLLSFRIVELTILAAGTALILGTLLWRLGWSSVEEPTNLLWVTVLYPLAFVVLGKQRGLIVAVAILASFAAALAGTTLAGAGDALPYRLGLLVANLAGLHSILIGLLWLMATRYETMLSARARAETLARTAMTDPLTGLANRRALTDTLDDSIAHAHHTGTALSVISVDLDHFKQLNDTHGHDAGDQALVTIATTLADCVRNEDLVGRWGGEEFLIIAPGIDEQGARALAERARGVIAAQPLDGGERLTASFGVASLQRDEDRQSLLRRVDRALYAAKDQGRNQVVLQEHQGSRRSRRRMPR